MSDNELLSTLVERYGRLKNEMDGYKKQVESDNKDIKNIMANVGINECVSGGYVAKYSVVVSENFDEDKLMSKLRTMNFDGKMADEIGLIEYVPKVNMEALENAIYNGKLNAADLSDCRIKKETPRLTISKVKEKK